MSAIAKQSILFTALILALLFSVSCATTTSDVYVPKQLGHVEKNTLDSNADLEIYPQKNKFNQGDPIEFTVTLKNTSAAAYWVPKNLSPTFIWYFRDGRRDGQLPQSTAPRSFTRKQSVFLEPGEELSSTRTIKTNYFNREGLVEFQSILRIPDNTNKDLQPFLSSKLRSNGYGLLLSEDAPWSGDLDPGNMNSDF